LSKLIAVKLPILLFLLICNSYFLTAQNISNFSYQLDDSNVLISYTLNGKQSERYEVSLYNSIDNYKTPLKLVSGDIGMNLIPSRNKTIIWDAKNELGEFRGNVSLKLKTRYIPFINFDNIEENKFKRGKSTLLQWEAAEIPSESIKLELFKNDSYLFEIATTDAENEYIWNIPKSLETGSNYKLRASAQGRFTYSNTFSIDRKIPLVLWLVPAAIIGGSVAIIANAGSNGNNNGGDSSIPDPLAPN
jgi:Ser-Thr-rich glycosyl-phosphatidyl-inositol-anchored membrane family protein